MTKSQRLCDKQDTLTDETIQRQSSACRSLRRFMHRGHVPQPRISFANDLDSANGQQALPAPWTIPWTLPGSTKESFQLVIFFFFFQYEKKKN